MASKRHLRRRACEGKHTYQSQTDAVSALITGTHHGITGLSTYRCTHCHHWHVGHAPRRVRQSNAAKRKHRTLTQ